MRRGDGGGVSVMVRCGGDFLVAVMVSGVVV